MLKAGYDDFTFLSFLNQNVHSIDDFTQQHYRVYQWHM